MFHADLHFILSDKPSRQNRCVSEISQKRSDVALQCQTFSGEKSTCDDTSTPGVQFDQALLFQLAHVTARSLGWQPRGFLPTLRLGLWGGSPVGFCPRYGSVSGVAAPWVFARYGSVSGVAAPWVFAHVMAQSRVAAPWVFAHVTAQSLGWQPCGFLHMFRLSLWGGSPMGFCTLRGGHIHTLT